MTTTTTTTLLLEEERFAIIAEVKELLRSSQEMMEHEHNSRETIQKHLRLQTALLRIQQENSSKQSSRTRPSPFDPFQTLKQLYLETNGTLWGFPPPNATDTPCNWPGVVCSDDQQQIDFVSISSYNVQGTIPTILGDLGDILLHLKIHRSPNLIGTIPTELGKLGYMEEFVLDGTGLSGSIPSELGAMDSLYLLEIVYSPLITGTIPSSLCNQNRSLSYLSIGETAVSGTIPSSFINCNALQSLSLEHNHLLTGTLPELPDSLRVLSIEGCGRIQGTIPANRSFNVLQLSSNLLSGTIPISLLLSKQLYTLQIAENNISGSIPTEIGLNPGLDVVDLSQNNLQGTIPSQIANLTRMTAFSASQNQLSGSIPSALWSLPGLIRLDLGSNRFSGTFPSLSSPFSSPQSISIISLEENQLRGPLPSTGWEFLPNLKELVLNSNNFTGTIPGSLGNCTMLQYLSLSRNSLVGVLPSSFRLLPTLQTLEVSDNPFGSSLNDFMLPLYQRFAVEYCSLWLVSANRKIQKPTDCTPCSVIRAARCELRGSISGAINSLVQTSVIDLSGNPGLVGTIPPLNGLFTIADPTGALIQWQANTAEWVSMDLSGCVGLTGSIPPEIDQLERLQFVNLSGTSVGFPNGSYPTFVAQLPASKLYSRPESSKPVLCHDLSLRKYGGLLYLEPEAYNWQGCTCTAGDVGSNGLCWDCPFGSSCGGEGMQALQGFWCGTAASMRGYQMQQDHAAYLSISFNKTTADSMDGDEIEVYDDQYINITTSYTALIASYSVPPWCFYCKTGMCCTANDTCSLSQQCGKNREGFLCSLCQNGTSLGLSGTACVHEDQCTSYRWIVPLAIIVGLMYPIKLMMQWTPAYADAQVKKPPPRFVFSCIAAVIIYYYQVLSLLVNPISRIRLANFIGVILGLANLQAMTWSDFSSGRDQDVTDWCIFPGVTPTTNEFLSITFPMYMLLCLGASLVILTLRRTMISLRYFAPTSLSGVEREELWRGRCERIQTMLGGHYYAFFSLLQLSYISFLRAMFALVDCRQAQAVRVLYLSPNIVCFQPWQYAIIFVLILLVSVPIAVWLYTRYLWKRRNQLTPKELGAMSRLTCPYRARKWYWGSVVLVRRAILVGFSSLSVDPVLQSWALCLFCGLFFIATVKFRPNRSTTAQRFDSILHFALFLISTTNLIETVFEANGISKLSAGESAVLDTLGIISTLLIVSPIVGSIIWVVWKLLWLRRHRQCKDNTMSMMPKQPCPVDNNNCNRSETVDSSAETHYHEHHHHDEQHHHDHEEQVEEDTSSSARSSCDGFVSALIEEKK